MLLNIFGIYAIIEGGKYVQIKPLLSGETEMKKSVLAGLVILIFAILSLQACSSQKAPKEEPKADVEILTPEEFNEVFNSTDDSDETAIVNDIDYTYEFEVYEFEDILADVTLNIKLKVNKVTYPIEVSGMVKGYRLSDGDILWWGILKGNTLINMRTYDVSVDFYKRDSDPDIQVTLVSRSETSENTSGFKLAFGEEVLTEKLQEELSTTQEVNGQVTDFVVRNGIPYILADGILYEYNEFEKHYKWVKVEDAPQLTQLCGTDNIIGITTEGKLYVPEFDDEVHTPGAVLLQELKEIDDDISIRDCFVCNIMWDIFLLENGTILYPYEVGYHSYQLEEEAVDVSGEFTLTETGNVYFYDSNSGAFKCIYEGGDGSFIDGYSEKCICVKKDGEVVSLDGLDCTKNRTLNWQKVIEVAQGFNLTVGLTEDGTVLYVNTSTITENENGDIVSGWTGIKKIFVYGSEIYALDAANRVFSIAIEEP